MDEINYTNLIDDEIARLVTALKAQKPESNEYKAIHSELAELDRIASESNYSRNELINIILSHGVRNIEIE